MTRSPGVRARPEYMQDASKTLGGSPAAGAHAHGRGVPERRRCPGRLTLRTRNMTGFLIYMETEFQLKRSSPGKPTVPLGTKSAPLLPNPKHM